MLKKIIDYTDFDGVQRKEAFYFNLSEAELMDMQFGEAGGLQNTLVKIVSTHDTPKLMELFKKIILMSYGEKSNDGRRFIKSKELTDAFTQTNAYSKLYVELASDDVKAAEFINAIIPENLANKVDKEQAQKFAENPFDFEIENK